MRDVAVDKDAMNRLVMNFLLVEGYKDAAENFCRESGCVPAGLLPLASCPPPFPSLSPLPGIVAPDAAGPN